MGLFILIVCVLLWAYVGAGVNWAKLSILANLKTKIGVAAQGLVFILVSAFLAWAGYWIIRAVIGFVKHYAPMA